MSEAALAAGRPALHRLKLKPGGMVKVQGADGLSVAAVEGRLWIIQEADVRDYELKPGESLAIGREGVTLIQALTASTFTLQATRRPSANEDLFSVVGAG
jgi:hypothetical protein